MMPDVTHVIVTVFIGLSIVVAYPSGGRHENNDNSLTNRVITKKGTTSFTPTVNSNPYGDNKYPSDLGGDSYVTSSSSSSSFNPVADDYKLNAAGYESSNNPKYSASPSLNNNNNNKPITSTVAVNTNYAAAPSYYNPSTSDAATPTSYPSYGAKFERSYYVTNYNTPFFNAWSSPTY